MQTTTLTALKPHTNNSGKTVYPFRVKAKTQREALNAIPGDFKVVWWNQDCDTFTIEIVRTF